MIVWHGSKDPIGELRPFLHVGTRDQAVMRGGRNCHLVELELRPRSTCRMRDRGRDHWPRPNLLAALRRGRDLVSYLNRHEGIALDDLLSLHVRGANPDRLSDREFRKRIPSSTDSHIVLDLDIVVARRDHEPEHVEQQR